MSLGRLTIAILLLAAADASIHVYLDYLFFGGNFFRNPLAVQFFLNFIGYVVLVCAFVSAGRWLGKQRALINAIMILYAGAAIFRWVQLQMPNPMGLGYLSKAIEVLLIVALLAHWLKIRPLDRQVEGSSELSS